MLSYQTKPRQPHLPSYPYLWLRIVDNYKGIQFATFGAIIDSGADYTCMPRRILTGISGYDQEIDWGRDFSGRPVKITLVRILDATVDLLDENGTLLLQEKVRGLRMPVIGGDGLLGRDILNKTKCLLDGPGQLCSFL